MSRIITVGREFGSGGRELGKRLADHLQIAYYDNEIVTEIAQKTLLAETYVHGILESNPASYFPITIGRTFYPKSDYIVEQNNAIYMEQTNIIREMAEKSDCVIIGRCADYILQEMNPLRLFVYAGMDYKMERCRSRAAEDEQLTDKELKRYIQNVDKKRSRYYEFYTGQTWGNKLNYDLCINTSGKSIKELVGVVAKMVK